MNPSNQTETETPRAGSFERQTSETSVEVKIDIDGAGDSEIDTGVEFFDHMLEGFSKHGLFDLRVEADGDLETGDHHTVEDVGICIGEALDNALGDKTGIRRFGDARAPLDEAVSSVVVDISGRPYFAEDVSDDFDRERIADMSTQMVTHFFRSLASNADLTLHVEAEGDNDHHIAESLFKAFGLALDEATRIDERKKGVPSTKGEL
ncbi:MAG: imidazoleglycerol-phosphate dehydratase HisB [Halobacteria archaeon]|nr:imidazoleglycerol-phosphate dehydratase HisB [Halobacteria archaeon]